MDLVHSPCPVPSSTEKFFRTRPPEARTPEIYRHFGNSRCRQVGPRRARPPARPAPHRPVSLAGGNPGSRLRPGAGYRRAAGLRHRTRAGPEPPMLISSISAPVKGRLPPAALVDTPCGAPDPPDPTSPNHPTTWSRAEACLPLASRPRRYCCSRLRLTSYHLRRHRWLRRRRVRGCSSGRLSPRPTRRECPPGPEPLSPTESPTELLRRHDLILRFPNCRRTLRTAPGGSSNLGDRRAQRASTRPSWRHQNRPAVDGPIPVEMVVERPGDEACGRGAVLPGFPTFPRTS